MDNHILTLEYGNLYCCVYRKGGLLLNNVVGIFGALAMGASKVSELYELLIMGRYLIGVNCGAYKNTRKMFCFNSNSPIDQIVFYVRMLKFYF